MQVTTDMHSLFLCTHSEAIKCTICTDILYQPATLECGHTFCRKCILQQLEAAWRAWMHPMPKKRDMQMSLLFNDMTQTLLGMCFQQNPGEEAALKERRKGDNISDEEFKRRYQQAMCILTNSERYCHLDRIWHFFLSYFMKHVSYCIAISTSIIVLVTYVNTISRRNVSPVVVWGILLRLMLSLVPV